MENYDLDLENTSTQNQQTKSYLVVEIGFLYEKESGECVRYLDDDVLMDNDLLKAKYEWTTIGMPMFPEKLRTWATDRYEKRIKNGDLERTTSGRADAVKSDECIQEILEAFEGLNPGEWRQLSCNLRLCNRHPIPKDQKKVKKAKRKHIAWWKNFE